MAEETSPMAGAFEDLCRAFTWTTWPYAGGSFLALKQASPPIPPSHGIYMIRAPFPLPRARGFSNVVYIGQSGGGKRAGRQGVGPGNGGPGRLFNTRGPDKLVREKIEAMLPDRTFLLQCSFFSTPDPLQQEKRLLQAYLDVHCELPPANHGI
jgi:hypothetical protein